MKRAAPGCRAVGNIDREEGVRRHDQQPWTPPNVSPLAVLRRALKSIECKSCSSWARTAGWSHLNLPQIEGPASKGRGDVVTAAQSSLQHGSSSAERVPGENFPIEEPEHLSSNHHRLGSSSSDRREEVALTEPNISECGVKLEERDRVADVSPLATVQPASLARMILGVRSVSRPLRLESHSSAVSVGRHNRQRAPTGIQVDCRLELLVVG